MFPSAEAVNVILPPFGIKLRGNCMKETLRLGISPCPNDTYIFHALLHGLVPVPFNIDYCLADVHELNTRASQGELQATKLSVGVLPKVLDNYAVLNSGGALGFGCGPLLVSKEPLTQEMQKKASIAIPGHTTTAAMLLDLHGGFEGKRQAMVFDRVMPAVLNGDADMGLIIHEGRFTYENLGLTKILDLGEWWESVYRLPLPLGCICVRRDVPKDMCKALETAISQSIEYARTHPEASRDFIRAHAQELSDEVIQAHISTFVNDFSIFLGYDGQNALQKLLNARPDVENISTDSIFLEN